MLLHSELYRLSCKGNTKHAICTACYEVLPSDLVLGIFRFLPALLLSESVCAAQIPTLFGCQAYYSEQTMPSLSEQRMNSITKTLLSCTALDFSLLLLSKQSN